MNESIYAQFGEQVRGRLGKAPEAMEQIAVAAGQMGQTEVAARLRATREQMKQETFNLMVLGRFKNGKSTFLNALLGQVDPEAKVALDGQLLPTDDLPTTATLTRISYDRKPRVLMWTMDGKSEEWSLEKYQRESSLREERDENIRIFDNIREFEVKFPFDLLKQNVVLMDSPGTDEDPRRDFISEQALQRCDAAFILYKSDSLISMSELDFMAQKVNKKEGLTHYFTIINLMYGRKVDERLKRYVWDRLISNGSGEKYAGQDLTARDIFFIDCKQAYEGVRTGNPALLASSGMSFFVEHLTKFLMVKRFQIHMLRWLERAVKSAGELKENGQRQLTSLKMDRQQFEANYQACLPKLDEIRRRKARITQIFDRYCRDAKREALTSYETLINNLERNLSDEMAQSSLPSLRSGGIGGFLDRFKTVTAKKKLAEEASAAAQEILKKRMNQWQKEDLSRRIGPLIEDMMDEIQAEVARIEENMNEINLSLTGWQPEATTVKTQETSLAERIAWAALGVGTGNLDWGLYGGALGWKGVLTGFLTEVGVGSAVYIFTSLALGPAVLIGILAGVLANLVGVLINADKQVEKIKRDTAEKMIAGDAKSDPPYPPLRKQMESSCGKIEASIQSYFDGMRDRVAIEVEAIIREEEQGINTLLENSRRESEDRAQKVQQVTAMIASIDDGLTELNNALIAVRQS